MAVNRLVAVLLVISLPALVCKATAEIMEHPQNISAVMDTNATFHCSGEGHDFSWIVYTPQGPILSFDRHSSVPYLHQRGIFQKLDPDGRGTTLHVLASQQNNNVVVRCIAFEDDRQFSYPATLTVTSRIPADWAVVAISTPPNAPGPVNGALYTITCNIQVMVPSNLYNGMTIAWSSNHGILSSDGNPKLGEPQVTGNIASQTLTFDPVDGSNTGEYTCTVTLGAPAVNPLSRNINVVLTTQGIFQLKIWPVQYCALWTAEYAARFEASMNSIVSATIEDRCGCSAFEISQGEFSCQSSLNHVSYRAAISSTNTTQLTSSDLLEFIADWVQNDRSFLHGLIRLQLVSDCPVLVHTLQAPECPLLGSRPLEGGPTAECFSKCLSLT